MDLPPAAGVPAVPEADPGMAPGAALPVVDPAAALSPQPEDPSLASPAAEEGTGCSVVPSSGNSLWAAALALALGGLLRRRRKS